MTISTTLSSKFQTVGKRDLGEPDRKNISDLRSQVKRLTLFSDTQSNQTLIRLQI